jgi:hypothetical protein
VVVSFVAVGAVLALIAIGVPLLNLFYFQQTVALMPFP